MPSHGYTPSFSSSEPYDTRYYEYAHLDDPKREHQQRFGPPAGVASEPAFWEEDSYFPSLDLPHLERVRSILGKVMTASSLSHPSFSCVFFVSPGICSLSLSRCFSRFASGPAASAPHCSSHPASALL
jgi:hypothetical protein